MMKTHYLKLGIALSLSGLIGQAMAAEDASSRKTQLLARPGAIAAFVRQPYWDDVLADAVDRLRGGEGRSEQRLLFPQNLQPEASVP